MDQQMPPEVMLMDNKPSNRIYIGDVTDQLAESVIERVLAISADNPQKPIVFYINSDGGSVHALLAIQAIMDAVPNPVVTVALGKAFSAGADILAHGDVRFVSPYARVMVHETTAGVGGHIEDLKTSVEEVQAMNAQSMEILANDMGKTRNELKELFKERGRDLHVGAEEAVKLGLADHVGVPEVSEKPVTEIQYEIALQVHAKPVNIRQNRVKEDVAKPKPKKGKKK